MAEFKKIGYHDMRAEAVRGNLPRLIGRREELARLMRIISRRMMNNCIIVGPHGCGKSALLRGFAAEAARSERHRHLVIAELVSGHLHEMAETAEGDARYAEALSTLPVGIILMDDFGRTVSGDSALAARLTRLYVGFLKKPEVRMILVMEPQEHAWFVKKHPAFLQPFEILNLKNQSPAEYTGILRGILPRFNREHRLVVGTDILRSLVNYAERFPVLGQLPRSAISLLDESLAAAATMGSRDLTEEIISTVVAGKTGIPKTSLQPNQLQSLGRLGEDLNARVIGQSAAIARIASVVQRAALGMRNPNKPLGSFLVLGPSGVGKTETAKLIAEKVFGRAASFTRFDMSEFGQEHTVQRLIGAPPGYLGHESGGALTNALKNEPHSLVLLDEIEKAHPKVFDIFLQVLDDGRLTSGQNETVDARHGIFMATSNVAAEQIAEAYAAGEDIQSPDFLAERIMPALRETFRLEFINRFDAILVFNPLTVSALLKVAELEIKKIEERLARHNVRFEIDPVILERKVRALADPRFGARPIKRFIEEACESLLVKSLLGEQAKNQGAS